MDLTTIQFYKKVNYKADYNLYVNKQVHNLYRYPAKLIPEIPIAHLTKDYIAENGVVYDPFCGSGTVLIEAQRKGLKSIGSDLNPLAVLISKVKTTPLDWINVSDYLGKFETDIQKCCPDLPSFTNQDYWFNKESQNALGTIRNWIGYIEEEDIKNFYFFVLASIIRKVSRADPHIFPPTYSVKVRENHQEVTAEQVFKIFKQKTKQALEVLSSYFSELSKIQKARCFEGSASAKLLPNNSVDLIITSPPYINAQKYVRSTKFELFWLDKITNSSKKKLDINIIGTERISKVFEINNVSKSKVWYKIVKDMYTKDAWRSHIIHRYYEQMEKVIQNLYMYLKNNRFLVLIVGNNTIRGKTIQNNLLLKQMAVKEGFKFHILRSKKDKIKSRVLPSERNSTASSIDFEYVLVLQKI